MYNLALRLNIPPNRSLNEQIPDTWKPSNIKIWCKNFIGPPWWNCFHLQCVQSELWVSITRGTLSLAWHECKRKFCYGALRWGSETLEHENSNKNKQKLAIRKKCGQRDIIHLSFHLQTSFPFKSNRSGQTAKFLCACMTFIALHTS